MNFIRNLILTLVVGGAVTVAASASQAAIYNYSFTDSLDTVSGTITLADGEGTKIATSITIATAPDIFGITTTLYLLTLGITPTVNNFTVSGGKITDYDFTLQKTGHWIFDLGGNIFDKDKINFGNLYINSNKTNYRGSITTPSAVPLPAALPLYGAGLAVMGFIGWRRSRKA